MASVTKAEVRPEAATGYARYIVRFSPEGYIACGPSSAVPGKWYVAHNGPQDDTYIDKPDISDEEMLQYLITIWRMAHHG